MAEENLKDFSINWIVTGLLVVALLGFAVTFIANNNPGSMGAEMDAVFSNTDGNLSGNLVESINDADKVLNITSETDPEASQLGSRDSVSSSFSAKTSAMNYWEGSKQLFSWTFSGAIGKILISTFAGILGFLSFYYITKFIRNGI